MVEWWLGRGSVADEVDETLGCLSTGFSNPGKSLLKISRAVKRTSFSNTNDKKHPKELT